MWLSANIQLPEIAEVYILASQESGGFCVLQLTNQLDNITEQLRVAFQAFGSNQQIETIQELLRKFQVSNNDAKIKHERQVNDYTCRTS